MTTLIFPSSLAVAQAFYSREKDRGEVLLAASSLAFDEFSHHYEQWFQLPMIYDDDFSDAFICAISTHNISNIYCPHPVVYQHLQSLIGEQGLQVNLLGKSPILEDSETLIRLLEKSGQGFNYLKTISSGSTLSLNEVAAIYQQSSEITGQTNDTKILSLMLAFAKMPAGDIIEIGSYWGKSAYILSHLAYHYAIGNVLTIDPWKTEFAIQKESPDVLQHIDQGFDWELIFQGFKINMLACAKANFSYFRGTSEQAQQHYRNNNQFITPEFGEITFSGQVACIHIDGNHDSVAVQRDYRLWRPHIAPGGWIILDDYLWPHGNGPKDLGDEILLKEGALIETSFVAGSALFIKLQN